MKLLSIQVALPQLRGDEGAADPMDRPWTSGFFKESVAGPVQLRGTNLEGDGQADREHHGGPDKAVLAYSADHYPFWRQTLNHPGLPYGAFGENFTVQGVSEAGVCVGDTWRVGDEVLVQVSQPRQPCWKLARRWRVKSLPAQVQETGRTGWYFRVLQEGVVSAGMPLVLVARPFPDWTVERSNHVMHSGRDDVQTTRELAAVPLLSESWRTTLQRRADDQAADVSRPLAGESG